MLHHYPPARLWPYPYTGWLVVFKNEQKICTLNIFFSFKHSHLPCIKLYLLRPCGALQMGWEEILFLKTQRAHISLLLLFLEFNFFSFGFHGNVWKRKNDLAIVLTNKQYKMLHHHRHHFLWFLIVSVCASVADQQMFWHLSSSFPCLNILTRVLSWFYF